MFSILFENLKKVNEETSNSEDIFKPWSEEEIKEMFGGMLKEQGCFQNEDGTWSSKGSVNISNRNLKVIPVQFKEVKGGFWCHINQLTSLKGCPEKVGWTFSCASNRLTSLEGCPKVVSRDFWCWHNKKEFTKDEVRKLCKVGGTILTY
jgi:hypothetical protein